MFVAVVAMVAFNSCSKDEEENNNPLVGTEWYSTNIYSTIFGALSGQPYYQVFYFKSNDTFDAYYENARTGEIEKSTGFQRDNKYEYNQDSINFGDEMKNVLYFISPTELSNHKDRYKPNTIIFNKRIK